jgi:hypothetical protein
MATQAHEYIDNAAGDVPQALAIRSEFAGLIVSRDPDVVLEEARRAATALTKVIEGKKKKVQFNGETYLENEDWLTVARFYGVTSRIKETRYVELGDDEFKAHGYEAIAEAYLVGSDQVISTSESMCLNDEATWARKPLFQLRSMAQTRASSRVLRQVFGWVVVLAGYKATPAEEMGAETPQERPVVQRKSQMPANGNGAPLVISEAQGKRLYAIAKTNNLEYDYIKTQLHKRWGFASSKDITRDKYDAICEWVEHGNHN